MTFTLTSLSRSQLLKVGKVGLWIIASVAVSTLVAWLTNDKNFLALAPAINLLGVALQQVFTQEEAAASAGIPQDELDDLNIASKALESEANKVVPGTVVTPAPQTTNIPVKEGGESATPATDAATSTPASNGVQ